ncbi:hypothetical protein [Aeromicrobium sp. Leaf291]|uniref:hypothetical protein n=1 Tax=Aeromicrobium sp. Leaf291 TaxID=1736325 RepID=UPI0012E3121D|nr:hypothetical protein [Aeromicrobium sp. Leaf291]
MVKAICPAQAIDEYTPDTWHDLLGDLDLGVALAAIKELGQTHRFIAPADIQAEVARRRRELLANTTTAAEPEWLAALEGDQHTVAYLQWRRERQDRILRGEPEPTEPPRRIVKRDLTELEAEVKKIARDKGAKRDDLGESA